MSNGHPTGKRLERLVAAIHHVEAQGGVVTWNDTIGGRQFDVTIRFRCGIYDYLTVIECKDHSSPVSVEKVDAFATKSRDSGASKAILISSSGFQSGCFAIAERHHMELLTLSETTQIDASALAAKFIRGLNVFDVWFDNTETKESIELEEWGGRLTYLMEKAKVVLPSGVTSPNRLVDEWQATTPVLSTDQPTQVEIDLPGPARLQIPYEQVRSVNRLRFGCSLIPIAISTMPQLDNHIRAAINTRVELRNPDNSLRHSVPINQVPLGFDAAVQVGKFYELPHLFARYYCDRIEGDRIRWKLVESYQHGHLIRAVFWQKAGTGKHYVEVTDLAVLARLRQMLKSLEG